MESNNVTESRLRIPMTLVAALLGCAAAGFLAMFCDQAYAYWVTAGLFAPTTVSNASMFGHLIRCISFTAISFLLARAAFAATQSEEFERRQRTFWRITAGILLIQAVYALYEVPATYKRDSYGFFRPEFESGYVELEPDRLEIRLGSETPVPGWAPMVHHGLNKVVFVSPRPEIVGKDIERAMVRVGQIYPGSQTVETHVKLTEEGGAKLATITTAHRTRTLAVLVDGKLRAAPILFSPITEGSAQLSNLFTLEEAARMIEQAR